MQNIEIEKEVLKNNNLNLENNIVKNKSQNEFLNSTLWKTINTGIDIGLRTLLPDLIEEQVIGLKDNLLNYGFKEGINKSINDAIDLGKSAMGIITGDFENITQMQNAVKSGGIIDSVDTLLDIAINKTNNSGIINNNMATLLRNGKDIILDNIEKNIEKEFTNQIVSLENVNKYIENWNTYYSEKDFESMDKEYKKIEKELKNVVPIEKTLSEARKVENIHNLIKNNGQNFDITETEKQLAQKL